MYLVGEYATIIPGELRKFSEIEGFSIDRYDLSKEYQIMRIEGDMIKVKGISHMLPSNVLKNNNVIQQFKISENELNIVQSYSTSFLKPVVDSWITPYFINGVRETSRTNTFEKNTVYLIINESEIKWEKCSPVYLSLPIIEQKLINKRYNHRDIYIPYISGYCKEADDLIPERFSFNFGEVIEFHSPEYSQKFGYYSTTHNILCLGYSQKKEANYYIRMIIKFLLEKELIKECCGESKVPKIKVSIGADPEFELYDKSNNEIINMHNTNFIENTNGKIGIDGSGQQLELRPDPLYNSKFDMFVQKMKGLFVELRQMTKDKYELSTVGDKYPLGGHWHIGINNTTVNPSKSLVTILDYFIGIPFFNCMGKARGDYRYLSAIRPKNYGFEYRTAPASCFSTPEITRICIKIIYNVVHKYYAQKTFNISRKVSDEALAEYAGLDDSEIMYFRSFISDYMNDSKDKGNQIMAAWTKGMRVSIPNYEINFSDEWRNQIKNTMRKNIKQLFKKYSFKDIVTVNLFGLSNSRSNHEVAGFYSDMSCHNFKDIAHDYVNNTTDDYQINLGFPYAFRNHGKMMSLVNLTLRELDERLNALSKGIKMVKCSTGGQESQLENNSVEVAYKEVDERSRLIPSFSIPGLSCETSPYILMERALRRSEARRDDSE